MNLSNRKLNEFMLGQFRSQGFCFTEYVSATYRYREYCWFKNLPFVCVSNIPHLRATVPVMILTPREHRIAPAAQEALCEILALVSTSTFVDSEHVLATMSSAQSSEAVLYRVVELLRSPGVIVTEAVFQKLSGRTVPALGVAA